MKRLCTLALISLVVMAAAKPPPQTCTHEHGCGASEGTPVVPSGSMGRTCWDGPNQCFGAVAINCTGLIPNDWIVQPEEWMHGGCLDGWCWINAGSWAHDQCCFTTPGGRWCGGPLSALNLGCVASWNRAVHRVEHGLNWRRYVNMCRVNTNGIVNFAEYCAPGGTIIANGDQNRCCSGMARAYSPSVDSQVAEIQHVYVDASFTPMVCKSPPPPPPPGSSGHPAKQCTSNSQCAADERCERPNSSATKKYCIKV